MRIRTAKPSDLKAVTALLKRACPTLMAASYSADVLAETLPAMTEANPLLLASGTYYVVAEEDHLTGCGGWTTEKPGSGKIELGLADLRHLAVDPDLARQGIGRKIYNRCFVEASKLGLMP